MRVFKYCEINLNAIKAIQVYLLLLKTKKIYSFHYNIIINGKTALNYAYLCLQIGDFHKGELNIVC